MTIWRAIIAAYSAREFAMQNVMHFFFRMASKLEWDAESNEMVMMLYLATPKPK